ncbi:MAG: hypothetical protein IH991_08855 [Planctomycetes bacterium]|nr:hypothetical protein [Planctomycetota bacterium]
MGFAFLLDTVYQLPLTALFLVVAVGALAFRARRRRGYAPFCMGLAAAVILLIGKFALDSTPVLYGGIALLFGASLWNTWPIRTAKSGSAAPTQTLYQIGSNESEN